jgi:hypothetical protein
VASPGETVALATKTIHDAEAAWLMSLAGAGTQIPGLYGGRLVATPDGFRLVRYTISRGVELSGTVRMAGVGPPFRFEGIVTVSGASAARGLLGYRNGALGGTLGGQIVGR